MNLDSPRNPNTGSRFRGANWILLLVALVTSISIHSHAAEICVVAGDVTGLQAALDVAAHNNEDDVLMLQTGYFDVPSSAQLTYYPTDQHDLTIAGGYSEFQNDPCGGLISNDARLTTIHGGKTIHLYLPTGTGSISVRTLTIAGVFDPTSFTAVSIAGTANTSGTVRVSNAVFSGNVSVASVAIFLASASSILIENSLFDNNATLSGQPSIEATVYRQDNALCMGIVHTTFVGNISTSRNVQVENDSCMALLVNDIFWGNPGGDLDLASSANVANVDLTDISDLDGATISNVLTLNPLFNADYSLRDFSPLRDAGLTAGFIFENGNFDVFGNPRIQNDRPDIGATEISDVIFAHPFDW